MNLFSHSRLMVLLLYYCLLQETHQTPRSDFAFPMTRKQSLSPRIIGGEEVAPHSYPFLAALFLYTSNTVTFCGGTLISPRWVLTAAHCVYTNPDYAYVVLGAHDVSINETSQVILKTTKYIVHEEWNYTTLQNDIALVKLPRNVTLDGYTNTVALAGGEQSYDEMTGTVVGWGRTEYSGDDISTVLRKVDSRILTNDECKAIDPYQTIIIPSHMCLDGAGPVGSCNGDSGGPLLVGNLQVGVVSFGDKNCLSGNPSVFTRVVDFEDWIAKHATDEGGYIKSRSLIVLLTLVLIKWCNYY